MFEKLPDIAEGFFAFIYEVLADPYTFKNIDRYETIYFTFNGKFKHFVFVNTMES